MDRPPYIIQSFSAFKRHFHEFRAGDLINTRIPFKPWENFIFLDLEKRGVVGFPSFLSQVLSSSKCAQAILLKEFMPPFTFVIKSQVDLLEAISFFSKNKEARGFKEFITKKDFANSGLGIKKWTSLEEVFNFAGSEILPYPFVLQPFFENWRDFRVIILGERYVEAYQRKNPLNFRQNLFFGGESRPYELKSHEIEFCKKVMKRGEFPYAHIDMIYLGEEGPYLSEINLKGGIKGAQISPSEYDGIIREIHEEFLRAWREKHPYAQVVK